ncbi:MAG: InlB B-repeat-containing protein, partial [Treponema sp.]|nr:InlB B-repeat-containing protein [Treponema sp.]
MNKGKFFLLTAIAVGLLCMACPTADDETDGSGDKTPAKETWTVSFDVAYDGGTAPAAIKVEKGKAAGSAFPANPLREDFEFTGWYNGAVRYTHQTAVTANISLTAQWDAIYTISFDIAYTEGTSPAPIKVREGQSAGILFPPAPERTDYNFRGWIEGADKYDAATVITKSLNLTADWFQG